MQLSRRTVLAGLTASPWISAAAAQAPNETIALWPGKPPGGAGPTGPEMISAKGAVKAVTAPRLVVYRPDRPNGTAVLVAAGGGYVQMQCGNESTPAAKWLQSQGITTFELIYRLPGEGWTRDAPFADAQRAMRIIRSRAAAFKIDPQRIGAMGFSAGGHLMAMTCVLPNAPRTPAIDTLDTLDAKPNFAGLLYPVITMLPPYNRTNSFKVLLGRDRSQADIAAYSPELHVDAHTPPLFLAQAEDDPISPVQNSKMMYQAAQTAHVPAELHLFSSGGHGWGMGRPGTDEAAWPGMFAQWMARGGFTQKSA